MKRILFSVALLASAVVWAGGKDVYRDTQETPQDQLEKLRKEREDILRRQIPELRREALKEDENVRFQNDQIQSEIRYWRAQLKALRPTDPQSKRAKALAQISHWNREAVNLWKEASPELMAAYKRLKEVEREMSDLAAKLRPKAPAKRHRKSRQEKSKRKRGWRQR